MKLNRRGLLGLAVILGLLIAGLGAAPAAAAPAAQDQQPVEIQFTGTVTAIDGTARTLQVEVKLGDTASMTYTVKLPADFNIADVAIGDTVKVEGTLAAEGLVEATEVEVQEEEEPTEVPTATLVPTAVLSPTAVTTATEAISGTKGNRFCWDTTRTHPVAQSMASRFGVSYEQVMSWFCQGRARGFGQIALALQTARVISGTDVISGTADMYLQKRDAGQGWGQIWKEAGLKGNWKKSSPPTVVTSTVESELTTGTPVPGAQMQGGKGKNKGADTGSGKGKGRPTLVPTPLPGQPAPSSVQPRGRSRFRFRLPSFLQDLTKGKGRGGKPDK